MQRSDAVLTDLEALRFLCGGWTGDGVWHDRAVALRAVVRPLLDALHLEVEVTDAGSVAHHEDVRFAVEGCVVMATTHPAPGVTQRWAVFADAGVDRITLLHGEAADRDALRLRWTIERRGEDAFDETMEIAPPGATAWSVNLRTQYRRDDGAPPLA